MGLGDQLLAAGKAKLRHRETGEKIAIGDGDRVIWCPLYDHNPYLSRDPVDEWVIDYPGHRGYFTGKNPYVWNYDYRAEPAEVFLTDEELDFDYGDYVLVESNFKHGSSKAKQWARWQEVVDSVDYQFIQPSYGPGVLDGVTPRATTIRQAAALMKKAKAYLGPDGCLHHLAAAFQTPSVVVFGAFAPPEVTGYSYQNIFSAGATGEMKDSPEMRGLLEQIKPGDVARALEELL